MANYPTTPGIKGLMVYSMAYLLTKLDAWDMEPHFSPKIFENKQRV